MTGTTIRSATVEDAAVGAWLAVMALGNLAEVLFGLGRQGKARDVLEKLFAQAHNRFSHQFAYLALQGDQAVGLLLAYPGHLMKELAAPMAGQMLKIYGVLGMGRFLRKALPMIGLKEAEPDEYFINTVAVLPEHQGQGVGTRLLTHADELARAGGLRKCALSVTLENDSARRLYLRRGYRIVATVPTRRPLRRVGCRGFYRMVKTLA